MVEKENDQGVVDPVKAKNLVRDMAILRAEELFTLNVLNLLVEPLLQKL